MSIIHYFLGNDHKRAKFIFDFIAPVYGRIDKSIQKNYVEIAALLNSEISLVNSSILDVGTGTGGWLASIAGYTEQEICGTDFSEKMLVQAKKNHPEIKFIKSDAVNLDEFKDNSFDVVTASFVLHGMKQPERIQVLTAMKRIARKQVLIHDFYGDIHPAVLMLEWLERSDYKNFKKNFAAEMKEIFSDTRIITPDSGSAVYTGIC